jgi:sirohydrochlorin ferrochelatase
MGQVVFFPIAKIVRHPNEEESDERWRMSTEIRNYYRRFIETESDPYIKQLQLNKMANKLRSELHLVQDLDD